MREIVLDTETTGIDALNGDRVVEIGCVELMNHVATGRTYHQYINPERDMPIEAFNVHGLSTEFLSGQPTFAEIVGPFLDFIQDSPLVIHNATFDVGFLNAELTRLGMRTLPAARAIDTVVLARRRFPGAPASLDALCRRFEIDNSARSYHGALLDAQLLAEVYLELLGGRQPDLVLAPTGAQAAASFRTDRPRREPRPHAPLPEELEAHEAFLKGFKTPPLWQTRSS
ncbi:DNA polymerase III subunit epsilon [Rhodospirillum centenum]|uniref:DNA polymerase III subunit epsilon n=1 Tax=Rhodospirillum centenum (strain ATCC 51521 / SW) TaxID=414684 RepID=B6IV51_RHOCS|nr:DNA polymerase III subunit epsilon [Rhodospirillum centenum]ACJ00175.1 DNA polymerase III, epsilon subunit [Rhodospirillum centenum SW]